MIEVAEAETMTTLTYWNGRGLAEVRAWQLVLWLSFFKFFFRIILLMMMKYLSLFSPK